MIRAASAGATASFALNELAHLALTSKAEGPIRDRLAFALRSQLAGDGLVVAREWRRIDIAVLRGVHLVAVVELEMMHTFGAFKPGFQNGPCNDYDKSRRWAFLERRCSRY